MSIGCVQHRIFSESDIFRIKKNCSCIVTTFMCCFCGLISSHAFDTETRVTYSISLYFNLEYIINNRNYKCLVYLFIVIYIIRLQRMVSSLKEDSTIKWSLRKMDPGSFLEENQKSK